MPCCFLTCFFFLFCLLLDDLSFPVDFAFPFLCPLVAPHAALGPLAMATLRVQPESQAQVTVFREGGGPTQELFPQEDF